MKFIFNEKDVVRIKNIISVFNRKDIVTFVFLWALQFLLNSFEVFVLSLIVPFVALLTTSDIGTDSVYLKEIIEHFDGPMSYLIFLSGITLGILFLFKGGAKLALSYFISKKREHLVAILRSKVYRCFLMRKYELYNLDAVSRNYKNTMYDTDLVISFLSSFLSLVVDSFLLISLTAVLFFNNPKIFLMFFGISFFFSAFYLTFLKKKVHSVSVERHSNMMKLTSILNRGLNFIKQSKLYGKEEDILSEYDDILKNSYHLQSQYTLLMGLPKSLLESIIYFIAFSGIGIWVYLYEGNFQKSIPLVALYILTLQKALPSLTNILRTISSFTSGKVALEKITDELLKEVESKNTNQNFVFKSLIKVQNVNYVRAGKRILNNVSFDINKGDRVAIIGESGSGKTSIIDIISGLVSPSSGEVFIDETPLDYRNFSSWRKKIGILSQDLCLFNSSIKNNILFYRDYDELKMNESLEKAQIRKVVDDRGLESIVAEEGRNFSGGQAQRLNLARVFYDDCSVLILDEATSALDKSTEKEINDFIFSLPKEITIIIIAHKESILEKCNRVFHTSEGRFSEITAL